MNKIDEEVSIDSIQCNMADCRVSANHCLNISNTRTSAKSSDKCSNCERLNSDLSKAQLEILSYEKIIKVLRDELYNAGLCAERGYIDPPMYNDGQQRKYNLNSDWTTIETTRTRKANITTNNHLIQLIPPTHNKYDVLTNLSRESETQTTARKESATLSTKAHRTKAKETRIVKSVHQAKHNILIIGDSHSRNSASLLQDNLTKDFGVSSLVKPGAQMSVITDTVVETVKSLKCDDVLVIWAGSNDISKNNTNAALIKVKELIKRITETNIVLIHAPHRYDLIPQSCVNLEVMKFNRQLMRIAKLHPNVHLLEVSADRNYFTKHGMHLNSKGKELYSQHLAKIVKNILRKEQAIPIVIPWIDPPLVSINTEIQDHLTAENRAGSIETTLHRRNCPVRRNPDFLWT